MARAPLSPAALDQAFPARAVTWETEGELAVLLRPRFVRGPLARWLQPRLRRPHFRVRLDALGSFVWERCDGRTTVAEIARALEERFGETQRGLSERLTRFLLELARGAMLDLRATATGDGSPRRCP